MVATFPPMWQLPFAPRSRGMTKPLASTYWLSSSRMQPAWHTRVPDTLWKLMTWFIRAVDKMISSKTGTLPPTMPVLPPCGFTARFLS